MSASELTASTPAAFGVPESHFLRLAADVLAVLELQSRERGLDALADTIAGAKRKAEATLRADGEPSVNSPGERKSRRFARAIRK
jgi:hypothetical protein